MKSFCFLIHMSNSLDEVLKEKMPNQRNEYNNEYKFRMKTDYNIEKHIVQVVFSFRSSASKV